jgi:hypothetical protein
LIFFYIIVAMWTFLPSADYKVVCRRPWNPKYQTFRPDLLLGFGIGKSHMIGIGIPLGLNNGQMLYEQMSIGKYLWANVIESFLSICIYTLYRSMDCTVNKKSTSHGTCATSNNMWSELGKTFHSFRLNISGNLNCAIICQYFLER